MLLILALLAGAWASCVNYQAQGYYGDNKVYIAGLPPANTRTYVALPSGLTPCDLETLQNSCIDRVTSLSLSLCSIVLYALYHLCLYRSIYCSLCSRFLSLYLYTSHIPFSLSLSLSLSLSTKETKNQNNKKKREYRNRCVLRS